MSRPVYLENIDRVTFQKIVKNGGWGSGSGALKCQETQLEVIFCRLAHCCVCLWFMTFQFLAFNTKLP